MTYKPGQKRGAAGTDLGGQFVGPKSIARALVKMMAPQRDAGAKDRGRFIPPGGGPKTATPAKKSAAQKMAKAAPSTPAKPKAAAAKTAKAPAVPATKKTAAEKMVKARRQPTTRPTEPYQLPPYLPAVALADLAEHRTAIYRGRRKNRREMLAEIDAELHRREVVAGEMAHAATSYDAHAREPFGDLSGVDDSPEARKLDELLAQGEDYRDAYAEAYNLNPGDLIRQELAASIDAQRSKGETREQTTRRLYDEITYLSYLNAEGHTNGHMLNRDALGENARRDRRGEPPITALSLFSGPRARARKYASEELLRFWESQDSRETFTEFRARMLGRAADKRAADRVRAGANNSKDFGL